MESVYYGEDVEALRAHRAGFTATSRQRSKPGRNFGRWGTKAGTISKVTIARTS
jgi:hypothetical protein